MTDCIKSTPELLIQMCQITMGFPKIRSSLQCLRISREGAAFIRSIFQHHRQVEMRDRRLWPILLRTAVAGLSFFKLPPRY